MMIAIGYRLKTETMLHVEYFTGIIHTGLTKMEGSRNCLSGPEQRWFSSAKIMMRYLFGGNFGQWIIRMESVVRYSGMKVKFLVVNCYDKLKGLHLKSGAPVGFTLTSIQIKLNQLFRAIVSEGSDGKVAELQSQTS
jgi:hypothetical protein